MPMDKARLTETAKYLREAIKDLEAAGAARDEAWADRAEGKVLGALSGSILIVIEELTKDDDTPS